MTPVYARIEVTNIADLAGLTLFRLSIEVAESHLRNVECKKEYFCSISLFSLKKGEVVKESVTITPSEKNTLSLLKSVKDDNKKIDQYSMFFSM